MHEGQQSYTEGVAAFGGKAWEHTPTLQAESISADRDEPLSRERAVNPHPRTADPGRPAPEKIVDRHSKPTLVFFYSPTSGVSRRAEGFLAQVLQRRRNHHTFALQRVDYEARPDLAARLGVASAPAIVVIDARRVRARLGRPRGAAELQVALAPWLR